MTKYFVNPSGVYIGGFDGAQPPAGSIEVPNPPDHGYQLWSGGKFIDTNQSKAARFESDLSIRGLTLEAKVDALWEKIMGGKPEKADALQVIETQVVNDSKT